jgi:hypothetical protein
MAVQIQLRNDTAANLTTNNPILALAEMGIETDTDLFKLGNGVDTWDDLPYGGIQGTDGEAFVNIDGGIPASMYGGITSIDGGSVGS